MRSECQTEVRKKADRHSSPSAWLVWSSDSADVLRIGATLWAWARVHKSFLMCHWTPTPSLFLALRIFTVTYFWQPDTQHICFCKHCLSINTLRKNHRLGVVMIQCSPPPVSHLSALQLHLRFSAQLQLTNPQSPRKSASPFPCLQLQSIIGISYCVSKTWPVKVKDYYY